jgi:hypothetical protein
MFAQYMSRPAEVHSAAAGPAAPPARLDSVTPSSNELPTAAPGAPE